MRFELKRSSHVTPEWEFTVWSGGETQIIFTLNEDELERLFDAFAEETNYV